MNGGGFGSMPKSLTCYICGRGYGTRSLKIHLKNCEIKWEHDQELKPKNQRRPCPQPPRGLMELLAKPKITNKDLEAYNSGAFAQYNDQSLNHCPHCGRTFGDKAFQGHQKICSAENPRNPLQRAPGNVGGTKVGSVKTRITNANSGSNNKPVGGGIKSYEFEQPEAFEAPDVTLVPCAKCGRRFGEDRISKHQKTCKVNAKPKKVKMFHKPITEKEKAMDSKLKSKQSKWREEHESFKQAMKYNRKMLAVERNGGDIRDLPPPPASNNSHLKPCPYCGRNFGEEQAARHIPKCKNTINKPAPPPGKRIVGGPAPKVATRPGVEKPKVTGTSKLSSTKKTTTTGGSKLKAPTNAYRKKF